MRCGNCKENGVTIDHVKSCYGVGKPQSEEAMAAQVLDGMLQSGKSAGPMNPASDAQINYVLGLQEERDLPPHWETFTDEQLRKMERPRVSGIITNLKTLARKAGARIDHRWDDVPAGRFALYSPGPDDTPGAYSYVDRQDLNPPSYGSWSFYEVNKPTEGRWKGYTFIKRLVGAPGDYRQLDMAHDERVRVLQAIKDDPKQAMLDYGLQSRVCGMCSSPLTNEESLKRGIGPICASKSGWF